MSSGTLSNVSHFSPFGGRRRRLSAWLLLGWAMFWLTTAVAQPFCCTAFAIGEHGNLAPSAQTVETVAAYAAGTSPEDSNCPDLTLPDVISAPAVMAVADRLEPTLAPPVASGDMDRWVVEPDLVAPYYSPPPAQYVPLYLRNLRFLI